MGRPQALIALALFCAPLALAAQPQQIAITAEGSTVDGLVFSFSYSGFNGGCSTLLVIGGASRPACVEVDDGPRGRVLIAGPNAFLQGNGLVSCPAAPGPGAAFLVGRIDGGLATGAATLTSIVC